MVDNDNLILELIDETEILGKKINLYNSIEDPLFEAQDVANWLGIKNVSQMLKQADVPDNEKGIFLKYTLGGNQRSLFITEDAMYDVLMTSRKQEAKPLRREIKLYLKQIRLTGGYIPVSEEDDEKVILAKAMKIMQRTIEEKDAIIESQNKTIENMEDDVEAYHDLTKADGYLKLIDVAAVIETGRNTLTSFLRNCNVITKQSGFNTPYRRFIKNGMFKVRTASVNGHVTTVPMVTAKGLSYMYKLMKKKDVLKDFDADALLRTIEELEVANP